ncbi:hypothetical protein AJ79_05873 [Helicocarpus griseus UAMH5409]|uniref:NACHT domain-containing protein n=1 Tax=Helicocarpus griseus UAMH5409 TaxID=1447875 RepID=A0A2B7XAV1_9EURO|nr:hypothetical protein AJ79_05873 [Helicocarpus griseus UAMH5409]
MEALGAAASVITLVEATAKVGVGCLKYINEVKSSNADRLLLQKEIGSMLDVLDDVKQLLNGPNSAKLSSSQKLHDAVIVCHSKLFELETKLLPRKPPKITRFFRVRQALKWPFESKEFEKYLQILERCRSTISFAIQVDQTTAIFDILDHQQKTTLPDVLSKLPSADGAFFDSHANEHDPKCHPDTRTDLLQQIFGWAADRQSQTIFWLNGMAGTGKSTISRTVARVFANHGHLGASFFFKRGEGDRGHAARFFTTIAAQLVARFPPLLDHVRKIIESDPDIVKKALTEQFDKLILEPLLDLKGVFPAVPQLVIVIDALDECEREQDISTILYHLARTKDIQSLHLRVFVTSRPELPIRLGFRDMSGDTHRDMVLHDIPRPAIEHDISVYLQYELSKIKDDHNKSLNQPDSLLPSDWPDRRHLDALVDMAIPLFIFAATMCRFIGDTRFHPLKRLELVLKYQTATQTSKFDKTYLPVLDQLIVNLDEQEREAVLAEFEEIVGSIIVLTEPLSASSLENLLGLSKMEVGRRLKMLHSVLSVPDNQNLPIRLLHLSFRDFLIDPAKRDKSPFFLEEVNQHKRMAHRCLDLLSRLGVLKTNICNLKGPGSFRTEIGSQKIEASLPIVVQYACRFWVYHLERSNIRITDGDPVDIFLREYLLRWIEALSLIGRINETIAMVTTLQKLVVHGNNRVFDFLHDAKRFILRNRWIIDTAPLQTYSSASVYAPESSIVKEQFRSHIPPWIRHQSGILPDWGDTLQNLDTQGEYAKKIIISNDNKLVAAETKLAIFLWDSETGELRQKLKHPPSLRPYDFAFAWNSDLLAVVGLHSIQIIKPSAGTVLRELHGGRRELVTSILFSPNDKFLASLCVNLIRLWDLDTGNLLQAIEASNEVTYSGLSFSNDANYLVLSLENGVIEVWNLGDKCLLSTFTGHQRAAARLAFSYDNYIVSISEDLINIWSPFTGKILQSYEDHKVIYAEAGFSRDRKKFAYYSTSFGRIILRESSSGKLLHTLTADHPVGIILFAQNDSLLVVASNPNIAIWDLASGGLLHVFEGHQDAITSIALSGDTKLLASASGDFTVRLWDLDITAPRGDADSCPIQSAVLSGDSKLFAASQYQHGGAVFDAFHNPKQQFDGNWLGHMAFSKDGRSITACSDKDRAVTLFSLATGEGDLLFDMSHLDTKVYFDLSRRSVLSRYGQFFASAFGKNSRIYMCNLKTRTGQFLTPGIGEPCIFSDDESLLATCQWRQAHGYDVQEIHLYDAASGKYLQSIDIESRESTLLVSLSKDNKLLIAQDSQGIWAYDVASGTQIDQSESKDGFWNVGTCPSDFSYVETRYGLLRVPNRPGLREAAPTQRQPLYKLRYKDEWVLHEGERNLWIPPEYRPDARMRMDFRNNSFLWGNKLGLVTLIEIECQ